MKDRKTKYVKVKMTPEEYRQWKAKALPFGSMTAYIRSAVAEFSHVNAKEKTDRIIRLGDFYERWTSELGHLGGNFNQSVKRANELFVSGQLSAAYMERLLVEIKQARIELVRIKQELLTVSNKASKL